MTDSNNGNGNKETTLREFVGVIFRRKGIILTVLAAALLTVLVIAMASKPVYLSTSRVLVNRGEPESVYNSRQMLVSWEEEVASEMEVLTSAAMAERTQRILADAKAVDSKGRPIKFDYNKISVTTSGKASVLVVTYKAPDKAEAREALRALTRAYIDSRSQERTLPVVDGFFQEQLEALRDQLSQWEQRRADFMADEGIIEIPSQRESLMREKEAAESNLMRAKVTQADYAARLEAIQSLQQEKRLNPEIEIFGIGDADMNDEELLFSLRKELMSRRSEYLQKRGQYTDEHPEVRAAKDVVDNLQIELDRQLDNYVKFLQARIDVARARTNSLETTIRGIDDQLSGLPDKEARLAQYDRIIDAMRTDYRMMVERQVSAKAETAGRPEWHAILIQPATAAVQQRTRDYIRMALVPLFALLIGLALAFLIDGLDHSIKDATDAETHLGVPVLGSLSKTR
jgi:polysaccharide biosynthesis transport protein